MIEEKPQPFCPTCSPTTTVTPSFEKVTLRCRILPAVPLRQYIFLLIFQFSKMDNES